MWPHDRRLPQYWQPDSNDMESDQLSTSRPFNSTPVREKQQTATCTWHRLHVYVKEEGKAGLHFNIVAPSLREEKRQSEPDADKFRDLGAGASA